MSSKSSIYQKTGNFEGWVALIVILKVGLIETSGFVLDYYFAAYQCDIANHLFVRDS